MIGLTESVLWVALCIYHEARGEPVEGQIAVAHVILNRAEKRGKTVKEIILQPHQFEWTNDGLPDYPSDFDAFAGCVVSALLAIEERMEGRTLDGADHYHAMYVHPVWAGAMEKVTEIGKHIFYRS